MVRPGLRFTCLATIVLLLLGALAVPAPAKSLYVISNVLSTTNLPVEAFNINANGTLTFVRRATIPSWEAPPVGLAIAVNQVGNRQYQTLFVTFEGLNCIQLLDAATMTALGSIPAPGAVNLAGIVVDEKNNVLYAVERATPKLFRYRWDPVARTLTLIGDGPVTLPGLGGQGAWGIALDTLLDRLYVANLTNVIPFYRTATWARAGSVTMAGPAVNVAIDSTRRFLYSGAGKVVANEFLDQRNLTTGVTRRAPLGANVGVLGLGVDLFTGNVYCTTGAFSPGIPAGNDLRGFSSLLRVVQSRIPFPGMPAGLAIPTADISVNPLDFQKTGRPEPAPAGGTLTYTLGFDNLRSESSVTNVRITDPLPAATVFIRATGGGVYDSAAHTVNWNIGTLPGGAARQTRQVVVMVKSNTPQGTIIRNAATIRSDQTGPTTRNALTLVRGVVFNLTFPLSGFTPTSAPVIAVLDHSVFSQTPPIKFYVKDGRVVAFNGETGSRNFGFLDLNNGCWSGYKNSTGTPFLTRALNYLGGVFLMYDGHSGYDYQVPLGTPVRATANGNLRLAFTDPVNGGGFNAYKTCYINHGNGITSWYLYVNLSTTLKAIIDRDGLVPVSKGQVIGNTGNSYLHFDLRRGGIQPANVIDPYKENLWEPVASTK